MTAADRIETHTSAATSGAAVMCPGAAPTLGLDVLSTIAEGLATADLASFLPAGNERRWGLIASTEAYEAWVIAWPASTGLAMHDHDGSAAAVHVVAGELRERFVSDDGVTVRWLRAGATTQLRSDHVHEVINLGAAEAVSVHVYSPPMADMSFRDDPEIDLRAF